MRALGTLVTVVAGLAILAPSAAAADASVSTTSYSTFSPPTVTIDPGNTVTWRNTSGGMHNVHFEDNSFVEPSSPSFASWTAMRRFDQTGTFRYYCEQHGGPGGVGMSGKVVVGSALPGGGAGAPVVGSLKVAPKRFCRKTTRKCPKPGAKIRFTLSEAADVDLSIESTDGYGSTDSFARAGKAGSNSFKYSGRKLKLGVYRVTVSAIDADGNKSELATAKFRVASSR